MGLRSSLEGSSSNIPSLPPSIDIRASVVSSNNKDPNHAKPRPRGSGKLLSSVQGVGLALMRLEHVEGAASGELDLGFELAGEDVHAPGVAKKWGVKSWWPDWWPKAQSAEASAA